MAARTRKAPPKADLAKSFSDLVGKDGLVAAWHRGSYALMVGMTANGIWVRQSRLHGAKGTWLPVGKDRRQDVLGDYADSIASVDDVTWGDVISHVSAVLEPLGFLTKSQLVDEADDELGNILSKNQ